MKPSGITNPSLYILIILMFLAISTCEKDDNDLPFSFEYNTLDINGNKKSTFKEGENIVFSFKITKNSNEKYWFYPYEIGFSEIFKIYKKTDTSLEYYLRPAKYIYCAFGPAGIPFELKVPLYNAETIGYTVCEPSDSLFIPEGTYESSFSHSFTFFNSHQYITDTLRFKMYFKIIK